MLDAMVEFELAQPTDEDARQVMEWRNDPVTLRNFFHQTPKVWEQFREEWKREYFNSTAPSRFAVVDGRRVAFLRFLPYENRRGVFDISIAVAPSMRGRGVGRAVIAAAMRALRRAGVTEVVAEIRPENTASRRAFEAAGFTFLDECVKHIADTGDRFPIVRYRFRWGDDTVNRVFVIAEAGSNWRCGTPARDMRMAKTLIDVAVEAGADAVKFQTYRAETVYVPNAGDSDYLAAAGAKESITDIFRDLSMPYEMIPELAGYSKSSGIEFMSTPFSVADFDAIDPFVKRHKIASYEISHTRLLERAGRSGKPLVLSTGASEEEDIAWAVETFRAAGGVDLTLMQCTAKYPAPPESLNLRAIVRLGERFGTAVGLSDHSREAVHAPLCAVALGATVIEKHYTLDNRLPGPDHAFAITADELKDLVRAIRLAEKMLGAGEKVVLDAERELRDFARRGVQATRAIAKGEALREGVNVDILRPGKQVAGVHPRLLNQMEGRAATRDIPIGDGIRPEDWEQ